MAAQARSKDWSSHNWSTKAVENAVSKSYDTIKLTSIVDGTVVSVHKELLCFFSPYYTAALKGNFLEAQKDNLDVELEGKQLKSFVTWIYTGKLPTKWQQLCALYFFADRADVISLRRGIINALTEKHADLPKYATVRLIFTTLPETSSFRRFAVDRYAQHWNPDDDDETNQSELMDAQVPSSIMQEFFYQVMHSMALLKGLEDEVCDCCNKPCNYHEHESKEEWEQTCGKEEDAHLPDDAFLRYASSRVVDTGV